MSKMNLNISTTPNNFSKPDNVIISVNYHPNHFLVQNTCKPPKYYVYGIGILAPLYRMKVLQRSYGNNNYKQEVADRFGRRYKKNADFFSLTNPVDTKEKNDIDNNVGNNETDTSPMVWCHAVSLGETNTVAPLLKRLMDEGCHIWLTNTTHTGYARSQILFSEEIKQGKLQHGFVPIDKSKVINKFLNYVKPKVALFVETELWANTLYHLANRNITSILINARLSEKSFIQYQKIAKVSQSMMKNIGFILAQDADSAKRFRMLGADSAKIRIVGSLKWTVNANPIDDSKPINEVFENNYLSHESTKVQKVTHEKVSSEKITHQITDKKNSDYVEADKDNAEEDLTSNYAERAKQRKQRKIAKQREKSKQQLSKKTTDELVDNKITAITPISQDLDETEKTNKTDDKNIKEQCQNSELPIENKLIPSKSELFTISDLKSEINQSLQLDRKNPKKRLVWVAASTHESEEEITLLVHQKIIKQSKQSLSNSLLIIVPRHPERFEHVAKLIANSGLKYRRRSKNERPDETTQVYLADSMSEMHVWYDIADVAFVGGSMVNCGGHNPVEAIALATPVIMGQYTQSCQIVVDKLVSGGVLRQIISKHKKGSSHIKGKPLHKEIITELSEQLFMDMKSWLENDKDRKAVGNKGKKIVKENQSVLDSQVETILKVVRPQVIFESEGC